jgi:hypothetical protein
MEEKKSCKFIVVEKDGKVKTKTHYIEQIEGDKKFQPITAIKQLFNILISIFASTLGYSVTIILEAAESSNKIVTDEHLRSTRHLLFPYNPKKLSPMEMLMMYYRYDILYDNDEIAYLFGITAGAVQKHCSSCFLLYDISALLSGQIRSLTMSGYWKEDFKDFVDPFPRKLLTKADKVKIRLIKKRGKQKIKGLKK